MGEGTKELADSGEDYILSLFGEEEAKEAVKAQKKEPKRPEPTEEVDRPLLI